MEFKGKDFNSDKPRQLKIKKIRQSSSHAVTNGRRSGSGKIVLEHYDTLTNLFSGSASVEPLTFGLVSYIYKHKFISNILGGRE